MTVTNKKEVFLRPLFYKIMKSCYLEALLRPADIAASMPVKISPQRTNMPPSTAARGPISFKERRGLFFLANLYRLIPPSQIPLKIAPAANCVAR